MGRNKLIYALLAAMLFMQAAHGYLLGLLHRGDGKVAKALTKKLLGRCPADNLGGRMLMGDISLMTYGSKSAMWSGRS